MEQELKRNSVPVRKRRRIMKRRKQMRLIEITSYTGYPPPLYWNGRYWRRIYSYGTRKSAKYFRKHCNKTVRKMKGKIGNGANYRKCAEFWHEIW